MTKRGVTAVSVPSSPDRGHLRCRPHLAELRRSAAAAVALETAVALPVFLTVMIGIFQYSIVLLAYCNATLACTQAARYAGLHSSSSLSPVATSDIKSMVTSKIFINSSLTPTVTVSYLTPTLQTGSNVVGNMVLVRVSWAQSVTTPFLTSKSFSVGSQDVRPITH
jgi:Flp pilus assembly protein TadG